MKKFSRKVISILLILVLVVGVSVAGLSAVAESERSGVTFGFNAIHLYSLGGPKGWIYEIEDFTIQIYRNSERIAEISDTDEWGSIWYVDNTAAEGSYYAVIILPADFSILANTIVSKFRDGGVDDFRVEETRVYLGTLVENNYLRTSVSWSLLPTHFADVATTAWFSNYVFVVNTFNLMTGTGNRQFSPNGTVTYAQAITTLWRDAGEPDATEGGTWYTDAVNWARINEVPLTFNPADTISRLNIAELFVWYVELIERNLSSWRAYSGFNDVDSPVVRLLVEAGIIQGIGYGRFNPQGGTTRAQFAAMLTRLLGEGGLLTDYNLNR